MSYLCQQKDQWCSWHAKYIQCSTFIVNPRGATLHYIRMHENFCMQQCLLAVTISSNAAVETPVQNNNTESYRPISPVSIACKLLEHVFNSHIMMHLMKNVVLTKDQYRTSMLLAQFHHNTGQSHNNY